MIQKTPHSDVGSFRFFQGKIIRHVFALSETPLRTNSKLLKFCFLLNGLKPVPIKYCFSQIL